MAYYGQFSKRPKCVGFHGSYKHIYVKLMLKRLEWRVVFPKTSDFKDDLLAYGWPAEGYLTSWYPRGQWAGNPKPVNRINVERGVNILDLDVNREDITRLRDAILENGLEGTKPETHDTKVQELQKTVDLWLDILKK